MIGNPVVAQQGGGSAEMATVTILPGRVTVFDSYGNAHSGAGTTFQVTKGYIVVYSYFDGMDTPDYSGDSEEIQDLGSGYLLMLIKGDCTF